MGDEEGGRRVGEISPGRRELEVGGGGGAVVGVVGELRL